MLEADGWRLRAGLHRRDECGADLSGPEDELDRQRLGPAPLAALDAEPAVAELVGPFDAGPLGVRDGPAVEPARDRAARRGPERPRVPRARGERALTRVAVAA